MTITEFIMNYFLLITVVVFASALLLHVVLANTLWGYRRRGRRDAKTGAARPYETGWTSPFVQQQVERYNRKLANLTHRAEARQNRFYQRVSVIIAEIERLGSRINLLQERFENPSPLEIETEELALRRTKNFYAMIEHIKNQQAKLAKRLSRVRTAINTRRQRYLDKATALCNSREQRINAYWNGVAQFHDDAPAEAFYNHGMSQAHDSYIARNDHILEIIDHYTEEHLKPDSTQNLQL